MLPGWRRDGERSRAQWQRRGYRSLLFLFVRWRQLFGRLRLFFTGRQFSRPCLGHLRRGLIGRGRRNAVQPRIILEREQERIDRGTRIPLDVGSGSDIGVQDTSERVAARPLTPSRPAIESRYHNMQSAVVIGRTIA